MASKPAQALTPGVTWLRNAVTAQIAYQREHPYVRKSDGQTSDPARVHQTFGIMGTKLTLKQAYMASFPEATAEAFNMAVQEAADKGAITLVGPRAHAYRTLTLPEYAGDKGKDGVVTRTLAPELASMFAGWKS